MALLESVVFLTRGKYFIFMTSGARQPGKVVPWTSFEEWEYVMECLYSYDAEKLKLGYSMVRLWSFRGSIPTAVEATGNLAMLKLEFDTRLGAFYDEQKENDMESAAETMLDELHTLQLAGTMALVRFVNEMVDPAQKGTYAQPITRLAGQIGLPRNLVDLRHSGTHDELPSLGVLQLAIEQSLEWLRNSYWIPASSWRQVVETKTLDTVEKIEKELAELEVKIAAEEFPDSVDARRMKIVARGLNAIEHLQISKRIQREFVAILAEEYQDTMVYNLIIQCLSNWTNGKFKDFLKEASLSTNNAAFKALLKEDESFQSFASPLSSTENMLDQTEVLLKKMEERKRQKLEEPVELSGWMEAKNWVPTDLGAPINFLDFV